MFLIIVTVVAVAAALVLGVVTWQLTQNERRRSDARVAALTTAIDGAASVTPSGAATPALFDARPRSAVQGRPLLKLGIGFAMAVAVIVGIAMTGERRDTPSPAAATTAASPESLELLSMRHTRAGKSLVITGLVRNAGSAAPEAITAVILIFDRDGSFVASGRAPLEFARLGAGDESPFQVTIPDVSGVGRYRVSFRTAAGVLRHVDRRPDLQVSTN